MRQLFVINGVQTRAKMLSSLVSAYFLAEIHVIARINRFCDWPAFLWDEMESSTTG
jgi:hypothetical protein